MVQDAQLTPFFMPHTGPEESGQMYQSIKRELLSQFRLPIQERRIFKLSYTNSRRKWQAEVGQMEEQEGRYEILAIFESKQYIVFTRTTAGTAGPIILVDKSEVTAVTEFEPSATL